MKMLLVLISIAVFFSGCTSVDSNAVVASIGDEKIYFDEFELYASPQVRKPNLLAVSNENRERLIKSYIELVVLSQLAEKEGFAKREEYIQELSKKRRIWIAQYFYWDQLVNILFTPEEISAFYERMDAEFKVRHIIIGFKGASNSDVTRSKKEAYDLINKVYDEANEGDSDFQELAKKYSEGPSAAQGGALPQFGPGKMEKSFENAVFNLKVGEISQPIETRFGFHVILLEGVERKIETLSLADPNERVRTYQNMLSGKNREIQVLFNQKTDSLMALIDFNYDEENIEWLSKRMAEIAKNNNFANLTIIENKSDFDRVLFKTVEDRYTIKNMLDDYGSRIKGNIKRLTTVEGVKRGLQSFSSIFAWSIAGKNAGYDKARWVVIQENNYRRTKLSMLYRIEKVRPNVKVTEEEIFDFYNRNIERYQISEKMEIFIIRQADIEIAAVALKKAVAGENWKDLVKEYSQGSKFEKDRAGLLGLKAEPDFGDVTKKSFEFGPDKIIPELVLNGNTFFIVKTGRKIEKSVRPFEKVKKDIRGAVSLRNEHTLMDEIVEEQKNIQGFTFNGAAILL